MTKGATSSTAPGRARTGGEQSGPALAEQAARCLQALGHPTRLHIIEALARGELTVGELEQAVSGSQSNVSQHLRILLDRGILVKRKDGNRVYYQVANPRVVAIIRAVKEVFCEQ